jgi:hypothetical protein
MTTENDHHKGWTPVEVVPTYVTIPVPQQLDYKNSARFKGAQSRIRNGDAILVNMSKDQGKFIRDAADLLGVPYASYVRWCAIVVARAMHKERTGEDVDVEL